MAENVCKKACYEAKTSVLLGINLRTFHVKPPYYWTKKSDVFGFPGGNDAKILLSLILRYLRTRQGLVTSEALLSTLTTGSENRNA